MAVPGQAARKETIAVDAHCPDKPALAATPADGELTRGPRFVRRVTLLLVLAAFAGLGAGPLFARDGQSQSTAAPSMGAAVQANREENGAHPAVSPKPKE